MGNVIPNNLSTDQAIALGKGLEAYAKALVKSYNEFTGAIAKDSHKAQLVVLFERGPKYIRIATRTDWDGKPGQVMGHSFVVVGNDAKFKFGDILKAASWKAPARNFARGNVTNGDIDCANWAGL